MTIVDEKLRIVHADAVSFQRDLSDHGLVNGVHAKAGAVVTQPTIMYIEALELLFGKLTAAKFDFGSVAAISGSGQQHGSVYWRTGAAATLRGLKPGAGSLVSQLSGAFSVPESPIWMVRGRAKTGAAWGGI